MIFRTGKLRPTVATRLVFPIWSPPRMCLVAPLGPYVVLQLVNFVQIDRNVVVGVLVLFISFGGVALAAQDVPKKGL